MVLIVSGCAAPPPGRLAESTKAETADSTERETAEPTPTPRPTRRATPRPTPMPEGELAITHEVVYAWPSGGDYTYWQVILAVENVGTGWAEMSGFDSDYQILDASGGLVATGSFNYEFPKFIGPGERGFLIADGLEDGVDPASFATVEADGRYGQGSPPDVTFTFENLQWVAEEFGGGGYTATGFVTASAAVDDAAIAVICIDATGTPLGATWTNLVQNLSPGEAKGFETVGASPPIDPAQCAEVLGFAQDTGF